MSALEQSLDAIIASDRKTKRAARPASAAKKTAAPTRTGKAARPARARSTRGKQQAQNALAQAALNKAKKRRAAASAVDASSFEMAAKVVVSGLPKDIKPHNVKEFFQSQLGGVESVKLSYNERGQSTGVATVVFKRAQTARKAVLKYNNAPIDGKRKTLKLELVVDPEQKSLAARIQPNVIATPAAAKKAQLKAKRARRGSPAKQTPKKAAPKAKKAAAKPKKERKKTVAQLDQEMADYFAEGQQQQSA